jgi:hypothetical protein
MTMKILLADVSADPGPDTLVVFRGGRGASLTTLRGDRVPRAFIAQAHSRDVEDTIVKTVTGPEETEDDRWDQVDDLLHDLSSMARILLGYRDGSPVGVRGVNDLLPHLDLSEAGEPVADLAVGDPVVITAPSDHNLTNARGRVGSIRRRRVFVDIDRADHARLARSEGRDLESGTISVPRRWVEPVETR